MKHKVLRTFSILLILAILLPATAFGETRGPKVPQEVIDSRFEGGRFIIQFEKPAALETGQYSIQGSRGQQSINSPGAIAYIDELKQDQQRFILEMKRTLPGVSVSQYMDAQGNKHDLTYQKSFNGLVVTLPDSSKETMKKLLGWNAKLTPLDPNMAFVPPNLPAIKMIFPTTEYELDMDTTLPFLGLGDPNVADDATPGGLWDLVGGPAEAGKDLKVAVLDTGIDINHDFFDPTGYTMPDGYPLGVITDTTAKVIVARGYYRIDDPPVFTDTLDHNGHGSHTSGTIAGNYGTVATVGTVTTTVSGIAPNAYLMNYQMFYLSEGGSQSAWDPELIMALEDLVTDGADVTSNSWGGGSNTLAHADPIGIAFKNVIDSGIVAVKSAGNEGRAPASVDTLSSLEGMITVGASTITRNFGNELNVTAPGTVTEPGVLNILATESAFTPPITVPVASTQYTWVGMYEPGNYTGCDSFDITSTQKITGTIALISRGVCSFVDKVDHAQEAGAVGVVVFNNQLGAPPIVMGGDPAPTRTIPSFMVSNAAGWNLADWAELYTDTAELQISFDTARIANANSADIIADFSGTGPNIIQGIGPHIVAPGVNILSAVDGNDWDLYQGTSMAAPHVSGAAVLLRQLHPDWTVAEIKSALLSKAETDGIYNNWSMTDTAGAMDRGSGRLDLSDLGSVDLFFEPPTLSFATMAGTDSKTLSIDMHNLTAGDTYSVTIDELVSDVGISIVPSVDFTPFPNPYYTSTMTLDVTLTTTGVPAGEYEGWIWFDNGTGDTYHIPYWVRVIPEKNGMVLLLDDDASAYGWPDVAPYYENLLTSMGIPYDYRPMDLYDYYYGEGLPSVAELQAYEAIIWFTGETYYTYFNIAASVDQRWEFLDYLNSSDAKVIVTGEEFGGYMLNGDSDTPYLQYYGFASDFYEDVFNFHEYYSPLTIVKGLSTDLAFKDVSLDVGYTDTAYSYQGYVDELVPYESVGGKGFIQTVLPGIEDSLVGIKRSAELTLENRGIPEIRDYRSLIYGFGLEAIVDLPGATSSAEFMQIMLDWLNDRPEASIVGSSFGFANLPTPFSATFSSNITGVTPYMYRWDWGDGSLFEETMSPDITHSYTAVGTYEIMLEIVDSLGHSSIDTFTITVDDATNQIYLPIIMNQ